MTILGKLGAALQGFWWGLDDDERRVVLYVGAYLLTCVAWSAMKAGEAKRIERVRAEVVAELNASRSNGEPVR